MKENTPLCARRRSAGRKIGSRLIRIGFFYYFWSVLADGQEKVMSFHCIARTGKIKVLVSAGNYLLLSSADKKHLTAPPGHLRYV
jgi:hypothetical protein